MGDELPIQPLEYFGPSKPAPKIPETPEERRWRYRRTMYGAGLSLRIALIDLYFGPNVILFGKLTRLSLADLVPAVQSDCVPVVRAMKEYQRDHGQLPESIGELIPRYLPSGARPRVHVTHGEFLYVARGPGMVDYDFTPGREGWRASGPFANGAIPLPPVTLGPTSIPSAQAK